MPQATKEFTWRDNSRPVDWKCPPAFLTRDSGVLTHFYQISKKANRSLRRTQRISLRVRETRRDEDEDEGWSEERSMITAPDRMHLDAPSGISVSLSYSD
jgi:hypothetical protein